MCGFAGFLDPSGGRPPGTWRGIAARMCARLAHRGPDASGVWMDRDVGLTLAHTRLAVIDLSREGHQPMASACGRYVLAYNGEVYNFEEIRSELEGLGAAPRWRGHSDTEVLLAAVVEWGVEGALARCNGMFAFALWDRRAKALYLARDRFGEKPLYYGWAGGVFVFGSELKALREHPGWEGRIDRDALALLLRHNYIPSPYSIYEGIAKLPSASVLCLRGAEARSGSRGTLCAYWSARDVAERGAREPLAGSDEDLLDRIEGVLGDAVRSRMVADVPLGAFLSGGIDSSLIVALMQKESLQPIKTFSIGFEEAEFNEAIHARAVAGHLGTEHTELYVTPHEARAVIPRLPELYDEPFADSSQIPTFLVAAMTREHVTVSLSGDAGDELFGGYTRYLVAAELDRRLSRVPSRLRGAIGDALLRVPAARWDGLFRALRPVLPRSLRQNNPGNKIQKLAELLAFRSQDELYRHLISHWGRPQDIVRGGVEPPTVHTDRLLAPDLDDFTQRMMYFDLVGYLLDDILVKVDRATMGVSLEARVPFLDPRVVELAWHLPMRMKIRGGVGKWALRQLLHRHVPRKLVERPKMGFGVPIDRWLRGPLRDWAEELLAERRLVDEGFFEAGPIRRKWLEHLSGEHDWQYYIWDVLMFQAWHEAQSRSEPVSDTTLKQAVG